MTPHFLLYLFFLVLVGQLVGIKLCYGKSNDGSQNNIRIETPEIKGSSMLSDYIRKQSSTLHTRYKRDFESKEEFERYRQETVKKLRQSLGLEPWPEKNSLNPRAVGKMEKDDIVIEKVIFEARPGYLINAVVFIPKNAEFPVPAIVNPYGHWPDKYQEEVQLRCIQLARRGYIALTYDPIGQAERAWLGGHEDVRRQAILSGHSLSGMMFWDTMRCIDYLYTRPDVDKNGVGCIGLSGGGFNTLYTSVLDERIKVSVPTVYATNFEMLIQRGSAGCCAYLPNHATYGEIDDMYALIAPRLLLILAGGEEDKWLSGGAMQNYKVAKGSYQLYGLDRLDVFIDESVGHTLSKPMREKMYFWFNKGLKGDDNPEHAKEDSIPELFDRQKGELDVFGDYQSRGKSLVDINKELVMELQKDWPRPEKQAEIEIYRDSPRRKLHELLGDISKFDVIGEVIEIENYDNYSVEKIQLTTEAGITLPAQLFRPAQDNLSGIILYIRTDETISSLQPLAQTIRQFLASNYAVFFVRVRGTWETNYKIEPETEFLGKTMSSNPSLRSRVNFVKDRFLYRDTELYSLALGKNLFGMRVYDLIQSVEYIKSRDEIKNLPIICVGEGLREGLLATYVTALDLRISSLITNGSLISYQYFLDNALYPSHEFFVPQILRYADTPEILAAIAPRKVYLINASGIITDRNGNSWQEGHALPQAIVNQTFEWTRHIYRLAGMPDAFTILSGMISYTDVLLHE
ncbi:hypothetical protein FJZ31_37705 [Candidatus Poribacteria bacterium]|nr:hypothetical protein [Candidatus Poribacteria bacterium]